MSGRRIIAALLLAVGVAAAAAAPNHSTVKIMTQNMDSGTDLGFVVYAMFDPNAVFSLPEAVDLTYAEISVSNIPGRADNLAAEIAVKQPDIVALQEVTLWTVVQTDGTVEVLDPLKSLLEGLATRGTPYQVVAVNMLTDLTVPGSLLAAVRYTDRDVMLVRADSRPPAFHLSDVHARIFKAGLDFGNGLAVLQGWISAMVHLDNRHFQFAMTHLESPVQGIPDATLVQLAQTDELLHSLRNVTVPVVICGDFNSDAEFGHGIDGTLSVALIEEAGYDDSWALVNPSDPGYTWPLFLEDHYPPPFFVPYAPSEEIPSPERIDLFFSKGLQVTSETAVAAPDVSDHKGVVATFQFVK